MKIKHLLYISYYPFEPNIIFNYAVSERHMSDNV